ncbi:cysteine-rich receptor-like protein kinase 15 [Tanacetum coccineum]
MMLPAFVAWLPRLSLSSSVIPIRNVDVLPRSPMLCPLLFLAWSRVIACLVVVHVPRGCAEQRISCSMRPCAGYASCGPVNLCVASQHQHILVPVAWLCLLHLALHLYAACSLLLNPYMYFFCSLSTSVQTSLLNVYLLLLFVYLCSELSAAVEFKQSRSYLLARLQHRNLVRLLGYSIEGSERLLMYEFVENASLDQFIFDPTKRATLDWDRRYKIIGGVARGLLYLHEDSRLKIIHRDMKASNVLLDSQMSAKIANFGMARLFTPAETQGNTSRIVGTYGYMAPEYAMHGQFSVKSDVFSFGVLVLEIVTGQKNHSFQNGVMMEDLLSHAWKSWRDGTASSLIDPILYSSSTRNMMRCIHIGLLCVQEDVNNRPTMASVYSSSTSDPSLFESKSRSLQRSVAASDISMNDLDSR